jgi:hypothetical protein
MSTIQVPVVDEYYESNSNSNSNSTSPNNMENGNELMLRCLTVYDASSTLFICGILSLVVVLYHGTKYEGKPLQNLGTFTFFSLLTNQREIYIIHQRFLCRVISFSILIFAVVVGTCRETSMWIWIMDLVM